MNKVDRYPRLPVRNRRSRTRRRQTGKRIQLTARDEEILRLLWRFHFLSSRHLSAFCKPRSQKRFTERLGDLYHETGLIERPKQQWDVGGALNSHCIYSLSDRGMRHLSATAQLSHQAVIRERQGRAHRIPQFQHALIISHYLAAQELRCMGSDNQRFVPVGEILERAKDAFPERHLGPRLSFPVSLKIDAEQSARMETHHAVPDALHGVEYSNSDRRTYRFFAVEVERTTPLTRRTLSKSSTLKKLLTYQASLHSGSYKRTLNIPNLFPVFVGRDAEHCCAIKRLAAEVLTPAEIELFGFVDATMDHFGNSAINVS